MEGPNAPVRVWLGGALIALIFAGGILGGVRHLFGATSATSVEAGNAVPVSSGVILNNGSPITLTAGTTTAVRVNFTVSDNNGCGDVLYNGTTTVRAIRSGVLGGVDCAANDLNCYITNNLFATITHSCPSATSTQVSASATATLNIYYFAEATDASSSFSAQYWEAFVSAQDASGTVGNATSSGVELNTLLAIGSVSSSLNYGTLGPGTNTGSTNQTASIINYGNASTSLDISGQALVSGSNAIATSSQHYATTTFTYGGVEQVLSATAQTVSGFLMPSPPFSGWRSATPLPSPLTNHASAATEKFLYVLSGISGGGTTTVLFAPINATGSLGSWTSTTPLPDSRSNFISQINNNFTYVLSGGTSSVLFAPINATGSLGSWTSTTPLPASSLEARGTAYRGYMYVTGGNTTATVLFAPINATGSLGSWTATTPLPAPLHLHGVTAHNGFLYILGGISGGGTSTVLFAPVNTTGSIGTWTTGPALPTNGNGLNQNSVAADGGFLYTAGGFVPGEAPTATALFAFLNTNGLPGSWSGLTALPRRSYQHGTALNNGLLYVTGGFDFSFTTSTVLFAPLASRNLYWGVSAPNIPGGSYTGVTTYTAVFNP